MHSSSVIHPKAHIGPGCDIGPFCVIGENVVLGNHCRLHSHVVIDGHTELGEDNEIFPFACIGLKTQDLKWKGGITRTRIGSQNTFREYVTIHSATDGACQLSRRGRGRWGRGIPITKPSGATRATVIATFRGSGSHTVAGSSQEDPPPPALPPGGSPPPAS